MGTGEGHRLVNLAHTSFFDSAAGERLAAFSVGWHAPLVNPAASKGNPRVLHRWDECF